MKIKNIAAICKKNKYAVIYERHTEGAGLCSSKAAIFRPYQIF